MACLICRTPKTIEAHLMPRAFVREVTTAPGEKHVLAHSRSSTFSTSNTGQYDTGILCGSCDGILGKHEHYVFESLKAIRARLARPGTLINASHLQGDSFVRFGAGICWKYSVTKRAYGRIEIGPYQETLASIAFDDTAIPASVDLAAIQLHTGTTEAYFYRSPLPDRQGGTNVVRFSVGGFVFFLKIDKRPNPTMLPEACWLRGKQAGAFAVAPAHMFEEWKLHAGIADRPMLRQHFETMRRKRQS